MYVVTLATVGAGNNLVLSCLSWWFKRLNMVYTVEIALFLFILSFSSLSLSPSLSHLHIVTSSNTCWDQIMKRSCIPSLKSIYRYTQADFSYDRQRSVKTRGGLLIHMSIISDKKYSLAPISNLGSFLKKKITTLQRKEGPNERTKRKRNNWVSCITSLFYSKTHSICLTF